MSRATDHGHEATSVPDASIYTHVLSRSGITVAAKGSYMRHENATCEEKTVVGRGIFPELREMGRPNLTCGKGCFAAECVHVPKDHSGGRPIPAYGGELCCRFVSCGVYALMRTDSGD